MSQHTALSLALAGAATLLAQACSDNGGTVAGEEITFDLVEATCDTDGAQMTVRLIDDVDEEEGAAPAKEVLELVFAPAAVELGEEIDLSVQGAPTVTFSTEGPTDRLPERLGDAGVRVLDGRAYEGTLVLDEVDCDGPTVVGSLDASLRTAAQDDTFAVDVGFTHE